MPGDIVRLRSGSIKMTAAGPWLEKDGSDSGLVGCLYFNGETNLIVSIALRPEVLEKDTCQA